ncbi:N-acetylmuramoyl-L-alanine amidase [Pseudoduganella sp. SL102]|uniref:peptidoglycan recognition protein family protein n=1 Tax=Pseudoduganella sp. SL102 TaxID=2995154 RepID=UPI00248CCA69|nr:N-acetylmuramoyl-L-alanine amidase [Pseudoduganella sp. SL102]WBS04670.1 N-acetylmuramoyl-L-alanine amidase [Pseudoduganella sp. SL102]
MADEIVWSGGKLIHARVTDKVNSKIEKGTLAGVNAIVVHQTGAATAQSSFSSYDAGLNGAHFLIDTDGAIYQTARIDQKCWHVGNIRSRCNEMKACDTDALKAVNALLFKKGESYSARIKSLSQHEAGKAYPVRYPINEDSLGIEIVGEFSAKSQTYATVNKNQNTSLSWLVGVLETKLVLDADDIYRHGSIAYKQASEGSTANWTNP